MAWLPDVDERPFSIAGDEPLSLTVARVGPFSARLYALRPGDALWVRGPLGQGFTLRGRRVLLAGGGYGVAPLLFLAGRAVAGGIAVTACIGARTAAEVLLAERFVQLQAALRITTEDGSRGMRGLVTDAVQAEVATHRPDAAYACGPARMLEAVDRLCEAHRLPRQLSWEAHMRCGIGLCGSCELPDPHQPGAPLDGVPHPGWLTCLDGPVSYAGESPI
jgi:dihydroorotate dehydrogenase electron transfer subunit